MNAVILGLLWGAAFGCLFGYTRSLARRIRILEHHEYMKVMGASPAAPDGRPLQ